MKKALSRALSLTLLPLLALGACARPAREASTPPPVELVVFAAASMTETLTQIAMDYKTEAPDITLTFNFDSSGTLKTQLQEGGNCDIFISAAQKQMNLLDAAADPAGLDLVLQGSRIDLLQNEVVLVVPQGNPAGVLTFDDVATDKVQLMALGNSDVPVGQYSEEIFTAMGLWDTLNTGQKITFATNVKEVTAQVSAGAVDCGVVYATDAAAAGLTVVAHAPADTHKPAVYPAALLNTGIHQVESQAFLDYLQTTPATTIFESAGFSVPD